MYQLIDRIHPTLLNGVMTFRNTNHMAHLPAFALDFGTQKRRPLQTVCANVLQGFRGLHGNGGWVHAGFCQYRGRGPAQQALLGEHIYLSSVMTVLMYCSFYR